MSITVNVQDVKINRSETSLRGSYSTAAKSQDEVQNSAKNWECNPDNRFAAECSYVLHLKNLLLLGDLPIHLDSNSLIWEKTLDHDFEAAITDDEIRTNLKIKLARSVSGVLRLKGRTLIISSRWDLCFFHFYNETLGKFNNLAEHKYNLLEIDTILFAGQRQGSWLEYWIEKLSISNKNLIFLSKLKSFLIDEAIYPSYSLPLWEFNKNKYDFILSVLGETFRAAEYANRRLFLSREGLSRRVLNENHLRSLATYYGFESIRPDLLSVPEQLNLFSKTNMVIGPYGGAFTNLLFSSRPEVFEFFGQSYINSIYYLLTRFKGGNYYYHISNEIKGDGYYIQEDIFKAWLEAHC